MGWCGLTTFCELPHHRCKGCKYIHFMGLDKRIARMLRRA